MSKNVTRTVTLLVPCSKTQLITAVPIRSQSKEAIMCAVVWEAL